MSKHYSYILTYMCFLAQVWLLPKHKISFYLVVLNGELCLEVRLFEICCTKPIFTQKICLVQHVDDCVSHTSKSFGNSQSYYYRFTIHCKCPHLARTKMKAWSKYEPWATEPAGDIKCNANGSNWERIPMPPGNLVLLWDYTLHVWNLSGTLTLKCTKHHVCVKVGPKVTKVFLYTASLYNTQCILLKLL